MFKDRYLQQQIIQDLKEKMVFLGGPRQVGKTTLAKQIGETQYKSFEYLNWDNPSDRRIIQAMIFSPTIECLIFDEIHKQNHWKNNLKGLFDKQGNEIDILVTGSARLDLYRKGGDSLMGRYHYLRLHPFSLNEIVQKMPQIDFFERIESFPKLEFKSEFNSDDLDTLLEFGGFPEPLQKQNQTHHRRWVNERLDRLIREDIRDGELIRNLSSMQILVNLLPNRVGSRLSINSLREDLEVSHKSLSLWLDILERFYYLFRIPVFQSKAYRSLKKDQKMYLWDWSEVPEPGARLENLVASHLLKFTHFLYDTLGYRASLHYLRDKDGREVDFLLCVDGKPWFAAEVKSNDIKPSRHLLYFQKKLNIPHLYQITTRKNIDQLNKGIRIISATKFLSGLV